MTENYIYGDPELGFSAQSNASVLVATELHVRIYHRSCRQTLSLASSRSTAES